MGAPKKEQKHRRLGEGVGLGRGWGGAGGGAGAGAGAGRGQGQGVARLLRVWTVRLLPPGTSKGHSSLP